MSDITIPPAAIEAAAQEIAPHPWSMYTEAAKDHFRHKARAACLAMLQNWPGVRLGKYRDVAGPNDRIILPLPPQEGE